MDYHPVFEFLPVEHLICEHQQGYYRALAEGDDTGDCTLVVALILTQIEKPLKQIIEETRGAASRPKAGIEPPYRPKSCQPDKMQ